MISLTENDKMILDNIGASVNLRSYVLARKNFDYFIEQAKDAAINGEWYLVYDFFNDARRQIKPLQKRTLNDFDTFPAHYCSLISHMFDELNNVYSELIEIRKYQKMRKGELVVK